VTDLKKEFGEQHVWGIVCDVREGKDVKALVDFARDKMKYIDIWVHNHPIIIKYLHMNLLMFIFFSYVQIVHMKITGYKVMLILTTYS
jgi:NAD(P)-dependent dehydrogenase (short-subunit alcohol dehydrogenase family)